MEDKSEKIKKIFEDLGVGLSILFIGYFVFRLFNWLASGDFDFWLCRMLEKFSE